MMIHITMPKKIQNNTKQPSISMVSICFNGLVFLGKSPETSSSWKPHLVMTNSQFAIERSTIFNRYESSISIRAIYTMASPVSHNQRVGFSCKLSLKPFPCYMETGPPNIPKTKATLWRAPQAVARTAACLPCRGSWCLSMVISSD